MFDIYVVDGSFTLMINESMSNYCYGAYLNIDLNLVCNTWLMFVTPSLASDQVVNTYERYSVHGACQKHASDTGKNKNLKHTTLVTICYMFKLCVTMTTKRSSSSMKFTFKEKVT